MSKTRILFIGGGPSTTAALYQLGQDAAKNSLKSLEITVVERDASFGPGMAYNGTHEDYHLLNTTPSRMNISSRIENDFFAWVNENQGEWRPDFPNYKGFNTDSFFPRKLYGMYLEERFDEAVGFLRNKGASIKKIRGEAVARRQESSLEYVDIRLNDGSSESVQADKVVLAIGNPPPQPIASLADHPHYINNIWESGRIANIPTNAKVAVIGLGLSAIDALRTLKERNHAGPIEIISRGAGFPAIHVVDDYIYERTIFTDAAVEALKPPTAQAYYDLLKAEIAIAKQQGRTEHNVIDSLKDYNERDRKERHITSSSFASYWARLSEEEKVNWNRDSGGWFNKLLFRVAPESYNKIASLVESSQALLRAIDVRSAGFEPEPDTYYLNCTGPDVRQNAFTAHLIETGIAEIHPAGGLRATENLRLKTAAPSHYYGIGPLFWGERFETVSVYSITRQAEIISSNIINYHKTGLKLKDVMERDRVSSEKILRWLVSHDTASSTLPGKSKATVPVLSDLDNLFQEAGLTTALFTMDAPHTGQGGLCATLGDPATPGGVIFSGHIDTVDFDEHSWSHNPLTLVTEGGRLYGRGTIEMKGQLAAASAALLELALSKKIPAKPVSLAITSLEEVGGLGSSHLAEKMKNTLHMSPELIQVIEPFDTLVGGQLASTIVTKHRGSLLFSLKVIGISGHSSNPDNGVDAVKYGFELWASLQQLQKTLKDHPEAEGFHDSTFSPSYPIINAGRVGTSDNAVANGIPGEFTLTVHCRINPGTKDTPERSDKTVAFITTAVENMLQKVQQSMLEEVAEKNLHSKKGADFGVEFSITYYNQPLAESIKPEILHLFKEAQRKTFGKARVVDDPISVAAATDAGNFSRWFPEAMTLVCGPGSMKQNAHGNNEYITEEQLGLTRSLVKNVIESILVKRQKSSYVEYTQATAPNYLGMNI